MPASANDIIESQLEQINDVLENNRKSVGFAKCHLRKNIPTLSNHRVVLLNELRTLIQENATWLSGFGFNGVAGIVDRSFAVRMLSSIELFGTESNGEINLICFANTRANNASDADVKNLVAFAVRRELLLVDWCRAVAIPPSLSDYMEYFKRG